jgi:hypothetical protein
MFCRYFQRQLLLVLICVAAPGIARGLTVEKLSFDQLTRRADAIVRGKVDEVKTRQASQSSPMATVVKVVVEKQFKGPRLSWVTIEQPGGSRGDIALGVPGSAEFTAGEDVILFLERRRGGTFAVVGGKQGKFSAVTQSDGHLVVEDFVHRTEALDSFLSRLASKLKDGSS